MAPEAQCESYEWTKYNDHCYKYFGAEESRSFVDAESYCQSKAGHLMSINSYEEGAALSMYESVYIWIGLRQADDDQEGGYYWTDGSPLDYTNYKGSQPDDANGDDNCILMDWNYYDYGWESHNCKSEMPFICEVLAGLDPPTTVAPPTISPPIDCNAEGWIRPSESQDYCYKFVASSSEEDIFDAAETKCMAEGGHLASIHSKDENDFVMINMKRNAISDGFIGLYLNNDGQYAWSDGTVPDYYSWAKGEPNNHMGLEGCSAMFTGNGHWNDVYCGRPQAGYVCKRVANGELTTPKPTAMPEGHCPSDHHEFQGYCYKLVGLSGNGSDHRNWTNAQEECQ